MCYWVSFLAAVQPAMARAAEAGAEDALHILEGQLYACDTPDDLQASLEHLLNALQSRPTAFQCPEDFATYVCTS